MSPDMLIIFKLASIKAPELKLHKNNVKAILPYKGISGLYCK